MIFHILGIDCATVASKVGLALASLENGQTTTVHEVLVGSIQTTIVATINNWLADRIPTLLAIDAPLGWPVNLGEALSAHEAGQPLIVQSHKLFRRYTDNVIREKIGRQPLDVGADRIARTAHAALGILETLRQQTGDAIPLSWQPEDVQTVSAIEVYPAATLTMYGIQSRGYKIRADEDTRRKMAYELQKYLMNLESFTLPVKSADALDAVVCVLAGVDYLCGNCMQPSTDEVVRKEGWIWVRGTKPGEAKA
jgi:predicted RNase H-like nuclease